MHHWLAGGAAAASGAAVAFFRVGRAETPPSAFLHPQLMYLVYLDESTSEDGDYFVVGGLAVHKLPSSATEQRQCS